MKRLVSLYLRPVAVVMVLAVLFGQLDVPVLQAQAQQQQSQPGPRWHVVPRPDLFGTVEGSAFHVGGWKTEEQLLHQVCDGGVYLNTLKKALAKQSQLGKRRLLTDAQAEEFVQKVCSREYEVINLYSGIKYIFDMGVDGHYGQYLVIEDKPDLKFWAGNHRAIRVTMDDGFYLDLPDMCSNPAEPEELPPAPETPKTPTTTPETPKTPASTPATTPTTPQNPVSPGFEQVYTCYDFFSGMVNLQRHESYASHPFGGKWDMGSQFVVRIPEGLQGWRFANDFFLIRQGETLRDINDRNLDPRGAVNYTVFVDPAQNNLVASSVPVDIPGMYTAVFPLVAPNGAYMDCRVPVYVQGRGHHCGKTCKILIIAGAVAAVGIATYFLWPRGAGEVYKGVGGSGPGR